MARRYGMTRGVWESAFAGSRGEDRPVAPIVSTPVATQPIAKPVWWRNPPVNRVSRGVDDRKGSIRAWRASDT
jgi:hypothetical protein